MRQQPDGAPLRRGRGVFCHRFRVRYAELDPQGVVFNARYLDYADLVLTEQWRAAGIHAGQAEPFECHVVKAVVDYRKPIRIDEQIDGLIRVAAFGTTSMTSLIALHGAGADDLRASIEIVHVHVDLATGQPCPIPRTIRDAFAALA